MRVISIATVILLVALVGVSFAMGHKVPVTPAAPVGGTSQQVYPFVGGGSFTMQDNGSPSSPGDGQGDELHFSNAGVEYEYLWNPYNHRYEDPNDPSKWVEFNTYDKTYTTSGSVPGWAGHGRYL